jgi:hypothetical protein
MGTTTPPPTARALIAAAGSLICGTLLLLAILLAFSGVATLGYQAFLWLRDGYWTTFELKTAWEFIGGATPDLPGLRGVQKILEWILGWPLSVGLVACGVVPWGMVPLIGERMGVQ